MPDWQASKHWTEQFTPHVKMLLGWGCIEAAPAPGAGGTDAVTSTTAWQAAHHGAEAAQDAAIPTHQAPGTHLPPSTFPIRFYVSMC